MRTALTLALSLLASSALAAPGYVPVQGVLADASGVAIDGQVDVTFTLYDGPSGATSLWSDTVALDVIDGRFAAELGANVPLDLSVFASYPGVHLGIQVAGDSAMPLVPLDHVPYAAWADQAGEAATLGGATVGDIRAEIPATTDLQQAARDAAFDTEAELTTLLDDNYLPSGYVPDWTDLTNRPAGLDDGDDVRSQAEVEGWARGVAYDSEGELTALLDDNYLPVGYVPDWTALTNRPAGLDDGDDDTQLTEAEVDGFVANNGYAATSSLATVATSGSYGDLADVPATVHYFTGATATPVEWHADVVFNGNYTRFCEALGKTFVEATELKRHYNVERSNGYYYDGWYYTGSRGCAGDQHVYGNADPASPYNVWRYDRSTTDCGCCISSAQWAMETSALITCQ